MLTVVPDLPAALPADGRPSSLIDQIVREGARQMLAAALQAEVDDYIRRFSDVRDVNGRRMVVRNGTAEPRTVLTSAGAVEVTPPRVNDKRTDPATGKRMRHADLSRRYLRPPKVDSTVPVTRAPEPPEPAAAPGRAHAQVSGPSSPGPCTTARAGGLAAAAGHARDHPRRPVRAREGAGPR